MSLHGTESTEAPWIIQSFTGHSVVWSCFLFDCSCLDDSSASKFTVTLTNRLSFHPLSVSLEWNHDVVLCDNPPVNLPHYTWHTWAKSKNHLAAESRTVSWSTRIKTFLQKFYFAARERTKVFAQLVFFRMATVHEFNRGSFVQIVLELIDDYVCNLKLFDTINCLNWWLPLFYLSCLSQSFKVCLLITSNLWSTFSYL